MNKIRGFRLSRRLVRVWRWVRRRRPRNRAYVRLTSTAAQAPCLYPRPSQQQDAKAGTAMATKIADWGRSLNRRFYTSSRLSFGRGERAGKEDNSRRLLGEGAEHRHQWKQQQQQQDEDESWWKAPPKGHLPVYVGRKDVDLPRRVLVPVIYFNHPLFGELLRGTEEEFDFRHPGGITIPCPISDFESVRTRVAAASGVSCRHNNRPTKLRWWPPTLT